MSTAAMPTISNFQKELIPTGIISSPLDLFRSNLRVGQPMHRRDTIYQKVKDLLYGLDEAVDSFVAGMSETDSIDIDETLNSLNEFKKVHCQSISTLKVNIENAYRTGFNDDLLLATIIVHIKMTDAFISSVNREAVTNVSNNWGKLVQTARKHKDICKTSLIVLMEPLLVYAVLTAFRKKDFRFVLKYEKEILNAARTYSDSRPEILRAHSTVKAA